jgi:hypothetical protein
VHRETPKTDARRDGATGRLSTVVVVVATVVSAVAAAIPLALTLWPDGPSWPDVTPSEALLRVEDLPGWTAGDQSDSEDSPADFRLCGLTAKQWDALADLEEGASRDAEVSFERNGGANADKLRLVTHAVSVAKVGRGKGAFAAVREALQSCDSLSGELGVARLSQGRNVALGDESLVVSGHGRYPVGGEIAALADGADYWLWIGVLRIGDAASMVFYFYLDPVGDAPPQVREARELLRLAALRLRAAGA